MPLYQYAANGDTTAVKALLQQGANADEPDEKEGLTPLMHAAQSPEAGVDMLRLLVQYGADVNAVNAPPPPPSLEWMDNLPEDVKKQMPKINADALGPKPKPVLHYAIAGGDKARIGYLVSAGADIQYQHSGGYDVLIDAVYKLPEKGRYDIIQWLIGQGAPLDGLTKYGESAVSVASRLGHFDTLELLLNAGADPEQLRWTPLMHAAVFGSEEDARAILQKRPYKGEYERFGRTAFLLAVQANRQNNAKALREAGAILEESDKHGKTALMYTAARDHTPMASWLLEAGAAVDAVDDAGQTALMEACANDAIDTAEILLEAGAGIHLKNTYGETAPGLTRRPALFRLLVEGGAKWDEASTELKRALAGLPADHQLQVSPEEYQAGKQPRFGKSNPEVMDIPFWRAMVKSGATAGAARIQFNDSDYGMPRSGKAVWCFERFGRSFTPLPDGRFIEIAGEHEDYYDTDFYIYNDVFAFDGKGNFTIYGYPQEVFPPTDFHTATLVADHLYIIGGLGYSGERQYGHTPVYRLDIRTFAMEEVPTTGAMPGWIYDHEAVLTAEGEIRISGGKVCRQAEQREEITDNDKVFLLNLENMRWTSLKTPPEH